MQNFQDLQMQIPQQFPSNISTSLTQLYQKQQYKQQIAYFNTSTKSTKGILKNNLSNKSVLLKQNNKSSSNINTNNYPPQSKKQEWKGKNIQQFLQFQDNFIKQKQDNILKLKEIKNEEEGRECTGRPSINSHSRKLTSQLVEPYFERLSKSKSKSKVFNNQQNYFKPEITARSRSMERDKDVSEILYNDALRRIQKQNINQLQKSVKTVTEPKINLNTDKLIIKTLRSQFQQLTNNVMEINLATCVSIVKSIFNIDLNSKSGSNTNDELLSSFAKLMFNGNKILTSKQKLWSFALIVMGSSQSKYFKQDEIKLITKKFNHLYRSRMTKCKKQEIQQIFPFKPEILKNSQKLAQRKRSKLLQQAQKLNLIESSTKQVAISDLYLMQRSFKHQTSKNKKVEQDQSKQAKECTFKPVLSNWKGYKECIIPSTNTSRKRSEHLKTLSRCENTNETLRSEYSLHSIKYNDTDRERQRCTSRKNSASSKQLNIVKNLELSVQRMSAARQQRQFSNEYRERGYPQNITNYQNHRKSLKKSIAKSHQKLKGHISLSKSNSSKIIEEPIQKEKQKAKKFIFDIHINTGVIETIRLNVNDDPQEIVMKLTKKHNLQEVKKQKLFDLICYYIKQEKQKEKL